MPGSTAEEQALIEEKIAENEGSYICPAESPFSNERECINCDPADGDYFFDYEAKECVGCPNGTYYDNSTNTCAFIPHVTNIDAIN